MYWIMLHLKISYYIFLHNFSFYKNWLIKISNTKNHLLKDHFFKNYDKLNAIIDKNIHINKLYYVRIYEMSTQANYVALKNLLEK